MPFDAFLRIDGVEGECAAAGHEREIDVVSFHWGASRPDESAPAVVHDFSFVKRVDAASPALFTMCCRGERAAAAVFVVRRRAGDPRDFLRYAFGDVAIVSVRPGGAAEARDDVPLEEVTLAFRRCSIECWGGAGAGPTRGGWGPH
jgi:type VI secretion system secreted protein Hcp